MSAAELTTAPAAATEAGLSAEAELARRCLYHMALMRETEDRIERKLYRQGKIVGGVYVGRGQEAIPVGTSLQALEQDVILPSHRTWRSSSSAACRWAGSSRSIWGVWMGSRGDVTATCTWVT